MSDGSVGTVGQKPDLAVNLRSNLPSDRLSQPTVPEGMPPSFYTESDANLTEEERAKRMAFEALLSPRTPSESEFDYAQRLGFVTGDVPVMKPQIQAEYEKKLGVKNNE